jgi:hypothetical protein
MEILEQFSKFMTCENCCHWKQKVDGIYADHYSEIEDAEMEYGDILPRDEHGEVPQEVLDKPYVYFDCEEDSNEEGWPWHTCEGWTTMILPKNIIESPNGSFEQWWLDIRSRRFARILAGED